MKKQQRIREEDEKLRKFRLRQAQIKAQQQNQRGAPRTGQQAS